MNEELMNRMLHATETSLAEAQAEVDRLERIRDALLEYLTAPRRAGAVALDIPETPLVESPSPEPTTITLPARAPTVKRGPDDDGRHDSAFRGSVQNGVRAILQEATRPLTAKELATRFIARGFYSNAKSSNLPTQLAEAARSIGAVKSRVAGKRAHRWWLPETLHQTL